MRRYTCRASGAALGGFVAGSGLLAIAAAGMLNFQQLFVPGVVILGFGTGIATSTNLALMLDMTLPEQAGLFIGAWGVADALARGVGTMLAGVVRDVVEAMTGVAGSGYISVFLIEAALVGMSLVLLRSIDVSTFRERQVGFTELVALSGEA